MTCLPPPLITPDFFFPAIKKLILVFFFLFFLSNSLHVWFYVYECRTWAFETTLLSWRIGVNNAAKSSAIFTILGWLFCSHSSTCVVLFWRTESLELVRHRTNKNHRKSRSLWVTRFRSWKFRPAYRWLNKCSHYFCCRKQLLRL